MLEAFILVCCFAVWVWCLWISDDPHDRHVIRMKEIHEWEQDVMAAIARHKPEPWPGVQQWAASELAARGET